MLNAPLIKLVSQALGLLLGVIVSLFCSVGTADAAELVTLNYLDTRITVPNQEFLAFANGNAVSEDLEAYFQKIPLTPESARYLLNEPILPQISLTLNSNLNEFLALQLNQLMSEPYGRESLDALKAVVVSALEDDRSFSLLELIDEYPEPVVKVYLGRLNRVHSDVNLFVERVQPILQQADSLLEDLVCECGARSGPALMSATMSATMSAKMSAKMSATTADLPVASTQKLFETYQISQTAALGLLTRLPELKPVSVDSQQKAGAMAQAKEAPLLAQALSNYTPPRLAKDVVITYGLLSRSLSIADLTTLAETGIASRSLNALLNLVNVSPENVQTLLNRRVRADAAFLDKYLNTVLGEFALFEIGQIVQTNSGKANIQALRSALIQSARNDNYVTFLEFLQNYPLPQIYVDGVRLSKLAYLARGSDGVRGLAVSQAQNLEDFLVSIQAAIAAEVCECEDEPAS